PGRRGRAMETPTTDPPKTATDRAGSRQPWRAAFAVRTLALVAACNPKRPASMEHSPPDTKASAVYGLTAMASAIATITTNQARIEYSLRRNAMAPVWISAEISSMATVPPGCETTYRYAA